MWGRSIIRKRRGAARLALYLLPVVLVAGALIFIKVAGRRGAGADFEWHGADYSQNEALLLLQEYLRFDTSHPDGNEIPAAEFLARQLEAAGIPATVERLGDKNANVWAILEGEDPRALVLHHHIDTDPVKNPELWRHGPWSGALYGPFVYGRGAFDMKSYAIAQLMSMVEIAKSGDKPRRSVIFLGTSDEESDSRLGTVWVLSQHPELTSRFDAVLTEGGAVEAVTLERVKYWGTEIGQKHFVDVWVCDADRRRLEALRQELNANQPEPRPPSPEVARYFRGYAPTRDHPTIRRMLENPEAMLEDPEAWFLPGHLKALLRNELAAFPVEADPEGGYRMRVILHLLPAAELDEAWSELLPDGLSSLALAVDEVHPPSGFSSPDHPVYRALHQQMRETYPDIVHGPLIVPWSATDARFFRAAGIPAYGFSPFWILSAEATKMKGANERIPVPSFLDGVELYSRVVRRLVM